MKLIIKKGTTSNIIHIFIQDSSKSDGSGLTGLVYNSTGLSAYFIRPGASFASPITLVTATVGIFTSGGFKEVDATNMPGLYELHIPNACFVTVADGIVFMLKGAANMAQVPIEIQLDDNTSKDIYDQTTDLHDEAFGKWVLDPTAKTLILYKADGVTVLKTFNLTDTSADVPAFIERAPV